MSLWRTWALGTRVRENVHEEAGGQEQDRDTLGSFSHMPVRVVLLGSSLEGLGYSFGQQKLCQERLRDHPQKTRLHVATVPKGTGTLDLSTGLGCC